MKVQDIIAVEWATSHSLGLGSNDYTPALVMHVLKTGTGRKLVLSMCSILFPKSQKIIFVHLEYLLICMWQTTPKERVANNIMGARTSDRPQWVSQGGGVSLMSMKLARVSFACVNRTAGPVHHDSP